MRFGAAVITFVVLGAGGTSFAAGGDSILFIGNSYTYGWGSPVRFYRANTVTDLNGEGIGGVPALFNVFTTQAGIEYDVYLETRSGSGLDFHLDNKLGLLGRRPWDIVVMHGVSTLDFDRPGDSAKLIATTRQMVDFLRSRNSKVAVYLMATWSRGDQTYQDSGPWAGKPIETMARDVRTAYDKAATGAPGVTGVIPVGEAWTHAMQTGVADPNPYDGIAAGKLNLWTYDAHHASAHGYYLEALVIFGAITGRDPRSLGENECSAFELGLSQSESKALQQIAFEQLALTESVTPAPLLLANPEEPVRCTDGR